MVTFLLRSAANRQPRGVVAVAVFAFTLAACAPATPPLYQWGRYEEILYESFLKPGEHGPVEQAMKLREDVEKTLAEGAAVPPGVHAHLGYLYHLQGDFNSARSEFETEKRLFPESATFVDGLIERLKKL